jgi:hypothetical protein
MKPGLAIALALSLFMGGVFGFFLYPVIGLWVFLFALPIGFLIGATVPRMIDGE